MENKILNQKIEKIIDNIVILVPKYMENPIDKNISDGHVALCIIDELGNVFGRLFGNDKIRSRRAYQVAWTKASQVWITGIATGEFEKKVFNGEIDDHTYGIIKPDMIGWEGGQPIVLKDGSKLSIGFSGFRGIIDLEIVIKAVEIVES
jgi:uncharacterized protein GlcG (DUF336 family)